MVKPEISRAQAPGYKSPEQVLSWIKDVGEKHPDVFTSSNIASSPGDRPLHLIRIGKNPEANIEAKPSIFVAANFEGTRPLSTEGAIFLSESILSDPALYESMNWYILPLGNPDAATRFFNTPLIEDSRNNFPTNDDLDDQTDEDGVNDLNGDGFITKMRPI